MSKHSDFVISYYAAAKAAALKYNINVLAILSQAAIESAWGTSFSVKHRKNFFGIIASGSPNQYWKGETLKSKASGLNFRVYPTAEASFYDFARLISSKYKNAASKSDVKEDYAQAIAYSPYIAEKNGDNRPGYERGVKSAWVRIENELKKKNLV